MRYKIAYIILIIIGFNHALNGQTIGIGASYNFLSNGININYCFTEDKNWKQEAGIRIMVPIHQWRKNKENVLYYQNGYAWKFHEYFSLNYRISRKIFSYKSFSLSGMANVHLSWHSLLAREYNVPVLDSTGWRQSNDVLYTKAAPAIEVTVGLMISYEISERVSIYAASGVGGIYTHYSFLPSHNWYLKSGIPSHIIIDNGNGDIERDRGLFSIYGTEGFPMMSVGVKYRIKQ